jgi:hypothetical protein
MPGMNPKLVRMIGWVSVATGVCALLVVSAVGAMIRLGHMVARARPSAHTVDFESNAHWFWVPVTLGLISGSWALLAGVSTLLRRTWARGLLEGLAWFLVLVCGYEVIVVFVRPVPSQESVSPFVVRLLSVVNVTLSVAMALGVLGLFLWFIRRSSVRKAFQRCRTHGQPNNPLQPSAGGRCGVI